MNKKVTWAISLTVVTEGI